MKVSYEWDIVLFAGTEPEDKITLRTRRASFELRQDVQSQLRPASKHNPHIDVCFDGVLRGLLLPFKIDRKDVSLRVVQGGGVACIVHLCIQ